MRYSALSLVCILSVLISSVCGHGHLSSPPYRGLFQASPPWYPYMDDAPVKDADGNNSPLGKDFVCRSNTVSPAANWTTLYAGVNLTIQMSLSAPHVGDCFLYLTYDADKPEADMQWFKIWQLHECKDHNNVPVSVNIPDYIPSTSHAILRWEWYALHTYPNVEFYAQCVDVKVNGIQNGVLGTPMVSIPGNLPLAKAADGTPNYRDPYNTHDGQMQTFFTGPKVAVAGGAYTPQPGSGTASTTTSSSTPTTPTTTSSSTPTTTPSSTSGNTVSPTKPSNSSGTDNIKSSSASEVVTAVSSMIAMLVVAIVL